MYIKKVFSYSLAKYLIFAIEGVLFFIISKKLGPATLGFYGFYMLLFGYLFFFNFGSIYALNKDFALNKFNKKEYIFNVLIIIFIGYTFLILILYIFNLLNYFDKYLFSDYSIQISIWWILFNIQNLIINIYRSESKIYEVLKVELFFTSFKFLFIVLSIFFFEDYFNLNIIITSIIISLSINIILNFKIFIFPNSFNFSLMKHIFSLGIGLLIYELMCILLISVDRLFVSLNYSAQNMGEYTFAFTINNFIFLFMNSILFILLPKMLIVFKNMNKKYKKIFFAYSLTLSFIFSLIILIFSLIFSPIIFYFYPEFYDSYFIFKALLVSNILYFMTFPITSYYISENMHYKLIKILILIVFSILVINNLLLYFKIDFKWVSFTNIFAFLFYFILLISSLENKLINLIKIYHKLLFDIFIFIISSLLYLLNFYNIFVFVITMFILFIFRYKYYLKVFRNMEKLLRKVSPQ